MKRHMILPKTKTNLTEREKALISYARKVEIEFLGSPLQLHAALLGRTIDDIVVGSSNKSSVYTNDSRQFILNDALAWINANDRTYIFSFEITCSLLNLNSIALRDLLLSSLESTCQLTG